MHCRECGGLFIRDYSGIFLYIGNSINFNDQLFIGGIDRLHGKQGDDESIRIS